MDPVPTAIVAGGLVIGGKWAQGKAPSIVNAIGIAGIAIGLAILQEINTKMSNAFSWVIILGVAVVYFPAIAKAVATAGK